MYIKIDKVRLRSSFVSCMNGSQSWSSRFKVQQQGRKLWKSEGRRMQQRSKTVSARRFGADAGPLAARRARRVALSHFLNLRPLLHSSAIMITRPPIPRDSTTHTISTRMVHIEACTFLSSPCRSISSKGPLATAHSRCRVTRHNVSPTDNAPL